jgi:hypothetical protein
MNYTLPSNLIVAAFLFQNKRTYTVKWVYIHDYLDQNCVN